MRKIVTLVLTIVLLIVAIAFNFLSEGKSNAKQQEDKSDHTVVRYTQELDIDPADYDHEDEHVDGDSGHAESVDSK